jgi:hypothetical protein
MGVGYPDDSEKMVDDALKLKIILNRRLANEEATQKRRAEEGDTRSRSRRAKERYGRVDAFRRVKFLDSKEVICLQVVDRLTGAIAYELNGHSKKAEASDFRIDLLSLHRSRLQTLRCRRQYNRRHTR